MILCVRALALWITLSNEAQIQDCSRSQTETKLKTFSEMIRPHFNQHTWRNKDLRWPPQRTWIILPHSFSRPPTHIMTSWQTGEFILYDGVEGTLDGIFCKQKLEYYKGGKSGGNIFHFRSRITELNK